MRSMGWFAGLLLSVLPMAVAAKAPIASLGFSAYNWVDVDAAGKARIAETGEVAGFSDVPKLAPIAEQIQSRLRGLVESWEFIPAMRNGAAVPSRTYLRVNLVGSDDGAGGLAIRIRSADTGAKFSDKNIAGLRYAGERAGVEGRVVIKVAYSATGDVISATAVDSKSENRPWFVRRADRILSKRMLKAAMQWKFKPEQVAGQPIPGAGLVPVVFCFDGGCDPGNRIDPNAAAAATDPEFAATDPAVKLRRAIAGTAL